jgi:hypothetical protein
MNDAGDDEDVADDKHVDQASVWDESHMWRLTLFALDQLSTTLSAKMFLDTFASSRLPCASTPTAYVR